MPKSKLPAARKINLYYGHVIVAASFLLIMTMSGMTYTFGVFLKPLTSEFGWARGEISGAYSLFLILLGVFFIFTGRLTDRFGPRIILTVCGIILAIGYLLLSFVNSLWQFYLVYGVIIALGISGNIVPLTSTISRWFIQRKGLMVGIALSGAGMGTILMPVLSTWLISVYGWRMAYACLAGLGFVVIVVLAQFLKRDPGRPAVSSPNLKSSRSGNAPSLSAGYSRRQALLTRRFWLLFSAYFAYGLFTQATMVHIVPVATDAGIDPLGATSILTALGALSFLGRIALGATSDKIGFKRGLVISFCLALVAFLWLRFSGDLWMFYVFAGLFGLAYGGLLTMEAPSVTELFGLKSHGAILGTIHFGVAMGGACGPLIAGTLFDLTGGYQLAFTIYLGFSLLGLLFTLGLAKKPLPEP